MEPNVFLPVILVVFCNVFYHIFSKNMNSDLNPFLGLMITYGAAFFGSLVLYKCTSRQPLHTGISKMNISNILMGLVIIGVEGGYILMYRSGWKVSQGSLIANMCIAVILFAIGIVFYKETVSVAQAIGMLLCITGLILLNR